MSMQNSIYGGVPGPSWYVFDKIHLGSAKDLLNQASSDGVFIGRYVLVKYCESLLEAKERNLLESLSSETQILDDPTGDKKSYFINYKQDGATQSYDRVVFQKIYKNNQITYHAICNLHQIQNIIIQPGEGGGTVVNPIRIAMIDPDPPEATDNDILQKIVDNNQGDIVIIRRQIANDKYSHTAYVYDSTLGWMAMDGNYSAENVFLNKSIKLTKAVGNYAKDYSIAAGTSLENVLSGLLQKEEQPTVRNPAAEITASGGTGEVGTPYAAPTATLKIDIGSYTYGPATGVKFDTGKIKLAEGPDPDTATNYTETTSVIDAPNNSVLTLTATSDNELLYTDSIQSYTFSGTASYQAATASPVTNLGNPSTKGPIAAGSCAIADKIVNFTGYRYAFAGGANITTLTSAIIRGMSAKKSSKASMDTEGEALEFVVTAGANKVFFAYPATWTGTPYFQMFGLAWAENIDIVAKDNIQVADYRGTNEDGTLNGATAYKLYCWELDTPLQAESTRFRVWFK